jgi:putative redox protein
MESFEVRIGLGDPSTDGVDPERFTVTHHLTDRAEIRAEVLSGGHLLHLAVAGCLFNDILREAKSRGITVADLRISAEGDFGGEPLKSTGITYSIDLEGGAAEDDLRRLVADCEAGGAIPHTLRQGAEVQAAAIRVHSGT